MKGYKALNTDLTARNGFQFEIGKEYTIDGKLKICKNGFHFCQNIIDVFGYWELDKENTVVCEVEAEGKILQEGTKFCSERIKLIRILDWKEIDKVIADGNHNSGSFNSGDYNSGDYNSGSFNSGFCNSGNRNSGFCNSGNRNSGDYNSGDCNSGDYNSGDYNSGDYNSGDYNSGFFNSDEPTVRLFNKDSGMTYMKFKSLGIDLYDLEKCKEKIKALPNYDAKIFYECTGIDWSDEE